MLLVVIVVLAIAGLLVIWWSFRASIQVSGVDDVRRLIKPVDLASFQNLISPAEDEFLRQKLDKKTFRRVQRARHVAAAEYLWLLLGNTKVLIRAGEWASNHNDAQVASAGKALVSVAAQTRVLALLALVRISLSIAFPRTGARCESLVERYGAMTTKYTQLGMLWRSAR